MKSFTLAALVAIAAAQDTATTESTAEFYGEGCKGDPTVCDATGETCVEWFDSEDYPRFTCQDCLGTGRVLMDEYQNEMTYLCPGEEAEGSTALYASAATLAAAVAMMY